MFKLRRGEGPGRTNHVYHLFTYTILNIKILHYILKYIQDNLTGQPETEIPNTLFLKYISKTCPV